MAKASSTAQEQKNSEKDYLVLARKYRPHTFAELRGQDALVRTLTNAIETGRIAHAFMLTGVRGVGKTTTARIIARALNCIGPDGKGGPTITPCGQCEQCKAITEDRHVDVIEMDAASRNGVDEVREIIDSVQYAPASARYKIFILDEVHMLSKPAFNALLKTLEEPPPHVKFIFATTEIRKVPVTVLSRCQRFDLRRIGSDVLEEYFTDLLSREGVEAEKAAVALIARAADGSARDGLSLLDQAISREGKKITSAQVRAMLGLADRNVTLDLFEALMRAQSEKVFETLTDLHAAGAEPLVIVQDLLDLTHFITKAKVAPAITKASALPEAEKDRGSTIAQTLSIPTLTRTWQMLLKGATEVQNAALPQQALEMVMIRLLYAAELPPPGDLVKQIQEQNLQPTQNAAALTQKAAPASNGATAFAQHLAPSAVAAPQQQTQPKSFEEVAALFAAQREMMLHANIVNHVHLVSFKPGHLEIRLAPNAPAGLAGQIAQRLSDWTGQHWMVSLSSQDGEPTLQQRQSEERSAQMSQAKANPLVAGILDTFPGAKIINISDYKD